MAERQNDGQLPPISGAGRLEGGEDSIATPQIEGYEIAGRLGQGGMGTVWRAMQLSSRREVALKVLGRGAFASEKERARFEREVELTARLQHPNIARLYDSGVHQGVHYYAMELIDGVPLDEYVKDQGFTRQEMLELMQAVCEAVQHAHQNGIIHRDLKPSNILVTPDGKPHVLDFGLAKGLLQQESGFTVSAYGEAAGTPEYMSPEQAAGRLDQIDMRTDVYSLGVIMFRLLTKEYPHDLSGTRYEVLRRIAEEEVRRPRQISREVDGELEALLLKALAHDPGERYPYAGVLGQDIENYLTGEPLTARPPTTAYLLRKRLWKHRVPIAIACSVLALLVGMAVFAYIRVSQERTRAVSARNTLQEKLDVQESVYDFLREEALGTVPVFGTEQVMRMDQAAENLSRRFSNQPRAQAAAGMTLGRLFLFMEEPARAERQFLDALELFEQVHGPYHPDTFEAMGWLLFALSRQGKQEEKEPICERILSARRKVLGNKHPATLRIMGELAVARWRSRRLEEAESLLREAVDLLPEVLEREDDNVRRYMTHLAVLLEERNKLGEAEQVYKDIVELLRSVRGEKNAQTLRAMNRLAYVLRRRGKLGEAQKWNSKIVSIRSSLQGEHHPDTLWANWNLESVSRGLKEPPPVAGSVLAFDEFDGKLPLEWQILNPDPSHYSITKNPGALTITAQDGGFEQSNTDYENLFLVNCPPTVWRDFQVSTCLSSFKPMPHSNRAGLILYEGDDDYLTFCYGWDVETGTLPLKVQVENDGQYRRVLFRAEHAPEKVWLCVTKQGNRYTFSTSLDGRTFVPAIRSFGDRTGLFQGDVIWGDGCARKVGLFAVNGSGIPAPETDAHFDFFEVRSLSGEADQLQDGASE